MSCTSSHFYPWADPLDSQAVLGGHVISRMHGTGDAGAATPRPHPSQHPAGESVPPAPPSGLAGHLCTRALHKDAAAAEARAPPPGHGAGSGSPAAATTRSQQVSAKHWAPGACSSGASRGTCRSSWRGWHPELPPKQPDPETGPAQLRRDQQEQQACLKGAGGGGGGGGQGAADHPQQPEGAWSRRWNWLRPPLPHASRPASAAPPRPHPAAWLCPPHSSACQ